MPAKDPANQPTTVIIGAGLSGLVAAHRLRGAGVRDVVVLEASDQAGGRLRNHDLGGGQVVELGGQWAARSHARLLGLASELGVETFPTWTNGHDVMHLGGKRYEHRTALPPVHRRPGVFADLAQSAVRLERMARTLPEGRPWAAARATEWDAITFQGWLQRTTRSESARALWSIAAGLTLGGAPHDVSLLFVLHHIRGAGGLGRLLQVHGGAQELRFVGGARAIADRLASELGDVVRLGTPVLSVQSSADGVRVVCDGEIVEATTAIIAISPADASRLRFDPPLPHARARLQRRLAMVTGLKIHATYEQPFWRARGLSGVSVSDRGPIPATFDNTPPSGAPGVLVGFATYDQRVSTGVQPSLEHDASARRTAFLESLATSFGPQALTPLDYIEQNWSLEPYVTGCIPSAPPGLLTEARDAIRRPVGRILWAGAESAPQWDGYMEGAVASGERAAAEALNQPWVNGAGPRPTADAK